MGPRSRRADVSRPHEERPHEVRPHEVRPYEVRSQAAERRQEAERRRALRRIARTHHPDLGGDPEAYLAAVAALEGRLGARHGPRVHVVPASLWVRLLRRLRRRLRAARIEGRRARARRRFARR